MEARQLGPNSLLVHAGLPAEQPGGSVAFPVFHSSTYRTPARDARGGRDEVRYIRYNNTPNQVALARRLAIVHGAEAGVVTASGMAAITATAWALHSSGDHVLVLDSLYGASQEFFLHDLPRWGIEATTIPADDPAAWRAALRPNTRSLYVEAVTNPLVRVPDHAGLVAFARQHGLTSVIDNTVATPVLMRPVELGYDLVLESCSKFIGGHSDLVAGAVVGSAALVERVHAMLDHHGGTLDPRAAYLTLRGSVTLRLRVQRQGETARELAGWLNAREGVARVHYPGPSPYLDGPVALLSFELEGGLAAAEAFLERLELVTVAGSLGGPETLITRPAVTAHAGLTPEERAAAGVREHLLRMSVGLEDFADLTSDLEAGLAAARRTRRRVPCPKEARS